MRGQLREVLDKFAWEVNRFLSTADSEDQDFTEAVSDYGKSIRASSDLGNRKRRHAALASVCDRVFPTATPLAKFETLLPFDQDLFSEEELEAQ